MFKKTRDLETDFLRYLNDSPTPYHAVAATVNRLLNEKSFNKLELKKPFSLEKNKFYYLELDGSLMAFYIPSSEKISHFNFIAAHTDSPNFRIKPSPDFKESLYHQLSVEVYGSPILNSWFDRDLSIAGRIFTKKKELSSHLIHFKRPLLRIPRLAIHLDRDSNHHANNPSSLNRQKHFSPLWACTEAPIITLRELCAEELNCSPEEILSFDLMLYDVEPASRLGLTGEFVSSARLDNLAMCHAATSALLRSNVSPNQQTIPMILLLDHEETGSLSTQGAHSAWIKNTIDTIIDSLFPGDKRIRSSIYANSMCLSTDMTHAFHPNYSEKYDPSHRPSMNQGVTIKVNHSKRYASSDYTIAYFIDLCRKAKIPYQWYLSHGEIPCGSTIGPILSSLLGIHTVDIGNSMLSMHSIREIAGLEDHSSMVKILAMHLEQQKS